MLNFLKRLESETKIIQSSDFSVEVTRANSVPATDDSGMTFANFETNSKKVKVLDTCAMFVDLRSSSLLNIINSSQEMAKLYSSYIRGVIACVDHIGGSVRNIVGDGILVVFDPKDCRKQAVHTAILINTFVSYILDRHFKSHPIRCGIGIDYGSMMVTKVGATKQGNENQEYKGLVWLGAPANRASELSNFGGKVIPKDVVSMKFIKPPKLLFSSPEVTEENIDIDEFFNSLEPSYQPGMVAQFKPAYANIGFMKSLAYTSYPSILMTPMVFNGYKKECPNDDSVKQKMWRPRKIKSDTTEIAYAGDIIFRIINSINS